MVIIYPETWHSPPPTPLLSRGKMILLYFYTLIACRRRPTSENSGSRVCCISSSTTIVSCVVPGAPLRCHPDVPSYTRGLTESPFRQEVQYCCGQSRSLPRCPTGCVRGRQVGVRESRANYWSPLYSLPPSTPCLIPYSAPCITMKKSGKLDEGNHRRLCARGVDLRVWHV